VEQFLGGGEPSTEVNAVARMRYADGSHDSCLSGKVSTPTQKRCQAAAAAVEAMTNELHIRWWSCARAMEWKNPTRASFGQQIRTLTWCWLAHRHLASVEANQSQ